METIKVEDIVTYKKGVTIYKVIAELGSEHFEIQQVITKAKYRSRPELLVSLNRFKKGDEMLFDEHIAHVRSIKYDLDDKVIVYTLHLTNGCLINIDENQLLNKLKCYKNENRLQEQENPESGRNKSRVSEQLCCRNRISYKCGYRGNKHSINPSKEYSKGLYDKLPLGY